MSKRIEKILDDFTTRYSKLGHKNDAIFESKKDAIITTFSKRLSRERIPLLEIARDKKNIEVEKINLKMQIKEDQELDYEKDLLCMHIALLDKAINERKSLYKNPKYPIEKNYARAPIISAYLPTRATLDKLRDSDGHIVQNRPGFRNIIFISEKNGTLLGPFDQKVFTALQALWEIKGGHKTFSFTFYELAELLEEPPEGGTYKLLRDSLWKIYQTELQMFGYHIGENENRITTERHHLIQSMSDEIVQYKNDDKVIPKQVTVVFNDYLHKGLSSGNISRINLSLHRDLSSDVSKVLYHLIASYSFDSSENLLFYIDDIINHCNLNAPLDDYDEDSEEYKKKQSLQRKTNIKKLKKGLDELSDFGVIFDYEMIKENGNKYERVIVIPNPSVTRGNESLPNSRYQEIHPNW